MDAWQGGDFTGSRMPMVRATIQRLSFQSLTSRGQNYTSIPMGQSSVPVELPNIKSVRWAREVDQTVATMSMELWNTAALPLGGTPSDLN